MKIKLSKREAIVLFEFLNRFSDKENLGIEDQSEARVLWDLECLLEKDVAELLQEDYPERLIIARNEVRDKGGTNSEYESINGRLALWLEPDDIKFLADEWRKIPQNSTPEVLETWSRIAFRAMSALHKLGIAYEPKFPADEERYNIGKDN